METVESFFVKQTSFPKEELFAGLAAIVEKGNSGSPMPVKCTKKLYNNLVNCVDTTISKKLYDNFCTIVNALRYITKGSPMSATGFPKLLSFGLPKKIRVCTAEPDESEREGWSKAADDLLFTLTVVINFSEDSKCAMIPLLPTLLQCISSAYLPASARIEATRGSNSLLEVCELKLKSSLVKEEDVKALILRMDDFVRKAGDFELQITTLECLFRLTTIAERGILTKKWFQDFPSVSKAFNSIRETFFEVDCRKFLNLLNDSCEEDRTVYSIPCKRAFLGSFELHQPREDGLDEFWVDFNIATNNMSLYTEDVCTPGPEGGAQGNDNDDMWESIIVKNDIVKEWSVTNANRELSLSLTLGVPAHSLLHSLPPSTSHKICITFDTDSDPTHPLQCIFSSTKQTRPQKQVKMHRMKQSVAVAPILLNPKFKGLKETDNISPIEALCNSPAGNHVNSQDSGTPPNHAIPPIATPATSTPKPHPLKAHGSSSVGRRLPLKFVSENRVSTKPKASQSLSSIVLGKNSRVVQRPVPTMHAVRNAGDVPQASVSTKPTATQQKPAVTQERSVATQERSAPVLNLRSVSQTSDSTKPAAARQRSVPAVKELEGSRKNTKGAKGATEASSSKLAVEQKTGTAGRGKRNTLSTKEHVHDAQWSPTSKNMTGGSRCKNESATAKNAHNTKQTTLPAQSRKQKTKVGTSRAARSQKPGLSGPRQAPVVLAVETVPHEVSLETNTDTHIQKNPLTQTRKKIQPPPTTNDMHDNFVETDDFNKASPPLPVCQAPSIPTDTRFTEKYEEPLKLSPPSYSTKKHHNSSFCSNTSGGSNRSRMALVDISKACLNRGGQKRVFNLSAVCAVPKQKRKRNRNQKTNNSNCTSLNSTANSAKELNAIPDSLPLNAAKKKPSNIVSKGNCDDSSRKQQYKRVCMSVKDDTSDDDSDDDLDRSWQVSPPKQKKFKRAPTQYGKPKPVAAKRKPKSKAILTSARTKSRPYPNAKTDLSSFDMTDCDFEPDESLERGHGRTVAKSRAGQNRKKMNTYLSPVSSAFSALKKKATLKPSNKHAKKTKAVKSVVPEVSLVSEPLAEEDMVVETTREATSGRKKRIIDDIYEPRLSPQDLSLSFNDDSRSVKHPKRSASPDSDGSPVCVERPSKFPKAKKPREAPMVTPHRASLGAGSTAKKGQTQQSNSTVNFTARTLLKDFEEEEEDKEEEEEQAGGEKATTESARMKEEAALQSACRSKDLMIKQRVPRAPKKQPRRSSGYYSSHYTSNRSDSESSTSGKDGKDIEAIQDENQQLLSAFPCHSTLTTPASSLHPSQVGANENITKGFAEICHSLIAQSGRKAPLSSVHTKENVSFKNKPQAKSTRKKSEMIQRGEQDDLVPTDVTLTQLSRDIVSRHKHEVTSCRSGVGAGDGVCGVNLLPPEHAHGARARGAQLELVNSHAMEIDNDPNSTKESDDWDSSGLLNRATLEDPSSYMTAGLGLGGGAGAEPSSGARAVSRAQYSMDTDEESVTSDHDHEELRLHNISSEMQSLMSTIRESLNSARKNRVQKKKASGSVTKRTPGELGELWLSHCGERSSMLLAYEQQLAMELERLENEVTKTTASEDEVTSFLRKKLKELTKSRQIQQSQLCRLRTLHQTFHEQLEKLEESQSNQHLTSQHSLKREMCNLKRKILQENQKKAVDRVKRSLQAMLMHM